MTLITQHRPSCYLASRMNLCQSGWLPNSFLRSITSSVACRLLIQIHRWPVNFPRKGQLYRKCFHLMTSPWREKLQGYWHKTWQLQLFSNIVPNTYCPILYHHIQSGNLQAISKLCSTHLVPQNFWGCHQPFSMMSCDRRLVPSHYLNQCEKYMTIYWSKKNHSPIILGRILTQHELISNCLINAFYWLWCVV